MEGFVLIENSRKWLWATLQRRTLSLGQSPLTDPKSTNWNKSIVRADEQEIDLDGLLAVSNSEDNRLELKFATRTLKIQGKNSKEKLAWKDTLDALVLSPTMTDYAIAPRIFRAIETLLDTMITRGYSTEGVYRLSCAQDERYALFKSLVIDQESKVHPSIDVVTISSLVKIMLRGLPQTLLTERRYAEWIDAGHNEIIHKLEALAQELPREYNILLQLLFKQCRIIYQNTEVTKMNPDNMGKTLGVSLLLSETLDELRGISKTMPKFFETMMTHYHAIFGVEPEEEEEEEAKSAVDFIGDVVDSVIDEFGIPAPQNNDDNNAARGDHTRSEPASRGVRVGDSDDEGADHEAAHSGAEESSSKRRNHEITIDESGRFGQRHAVDSSEEDEDNELDDDYEQYKRPERKQQHNNTKKKPPSSDAFSKFDRKNAVPVANVDSSSGESSDDDDGDDGSSSGEDSDSDSHHHRTRGGPNTQVREKKKRQLRFTTPESNTNVYHDDDDDDDGQDEDEEYMDKPAIRASVFAHPNEKKLPRASTSSYHRNQLQDYTRAPLRTLRLLGKVADLALTMHAREQRKMLSISDKFREAAACERKSKSLNRVWARTSEAFRQSEAIRETMLAYLDQNIRQQVPETVYMTEVHGDLLAKRNRHVTKLNTRESDANTATSASVAERRNTKVEMTRAKSHESHEQMSTDAYSFQRTRMTQQKLMLETYAKSHLFYYTKRVELLAKLYADIAEVDPMQDASVLYSALLRMDYTHRV